MATKTSRKKNHPEPRPSNDVPTRADLDTVVAWKQLWKACKAGQAPTTRALAESLGVSQTAANYRLRRAVDKGLLERKPITVLGPYEVSDEGERWLSMAG